MKLGEKVAIVVSAVALMLSFASLYFQFFHMRHTLALSSHDVSKRHDGFYHAELVLANAGNRSIAVNDIHFCAINEDAPSFEAAAIWSHVETYVDDVLSDIVLAHVLTTIPPGELRVVRLRSKLDFSDYEYRHGQTINIGICLRAYTSAAEQTFIGLMPFTTLLDDQGLPIYPGRGDHFEKEHRKRLAL